MLYVRFPLSLRNVEDLLHERGIDESHETVRFWWNCFGPMFPSPHLQQPPSRNNKTSATTCPWVLASHTPLGTRHQSIAADVLYPAVKIDPKTLRSCCSGEVTAPFNNPDA